MTLNRPKKNIFLARLWPGLLSFAQAGQDMRFYRRIYADILGLKQSQAVRKYQDYESIMALAAICNLPEELESHVARFAMSVLFSAVYGTRIGRLDHPVMVELRNMWETGLHSKLQSIFSKENDINHDLDIQPGHLIIDWLPILEKLPLCLQPWVKLADSLHESQATVFMAFLKLLKSRIEAGTEPACFGVDALAHQKKQGFDDVVLIDLLMGLIVTGADTTSTMTQSFIKLIAMHPEAQKKAQEGK